MSAPSRISLDATREIADRELDVSDGHTRVGVILVLGRAFMSFDLAEHHRGTFTAQRDAMRALGSGSAAHVG